MATTATDEQGTPTTPMPEGDTGEGVTQTPQQADQTPEDMGQMLKDLRKLYADTLTLFAKEPEAEKATPKEKVEDTDLATELAAVRAERDEARKTAQDALRQSILIHKGLRSPRFSKQLLAEYDGSEDFETFVDKCKSDKDLSLLFKGPPSAETEHLPHKGNLAGPSGGSPGPRTGGTRTAEAGHREFAEGRWPDNKSLQEQYVRNRMALEKRGT